MPIGRAGQQQLIDLLDQLRAGSAVSHKAGQPDEKKPPAERGIKHD
jgi:hypothetical protein